MAMGRWTIAGSLGLVASIAVGLAAVRDASLIWAASVPLLSSALFAFALAMALVRQGRRVGWLGFAALGLPYFLMSVVPGSMIGPVSAITRLIDSASARLEPPAPVIRQLWLPRDEWMKLPLGERQARAILIGLDAEKDRQFTVAMRTRRESFRSIAQSLLSLILGSAGALVFGSAAWIARRCIAPTGPKPDAMSCLEADRIGRRGEEAHTPCP